MSNDTPRGEQGNPPADRTELIEQHDDTAVLAASGPTEQRSEEARADDAPFWDPTAEGNRTEAAYADTAPAAAAPAAGPVQDPAPDQAPDQALDQPYGQAHGQANGQAYAVAPERLPAPTGPHLPAIVLGVLALLVAGLAVADSTMSLDVDWNVTGPIGVVVVGGALVLLGALGLAGNRRRN